jgi:SNF2 family DNA or RNA helicase
MVGNMRKFVNERLSFYKQTEKEDAQTFYSILDKYESIIKSPEERSDLATYRSNINLIIKAHHAKDLKSVKDESIFCNKIDKNKIIPTLSKSDKELFIHTKTLVKYASLKVQGECLGRILGGKRIQCHVDMVKGIDFVSICESTTKKTIVFTSFVDALKEVSLSCSNKGLEPVVVYGGTNNELNSIIQKFEKDKDINPLIATYNSLSTAVPLVMADTMIMLNMPFRDYIYQQAISRIHRLDADTQTYVYLISLDTGEEPNLSTRTTDILKWSQSQIEKIMGIKSPFEVTEDTNIEGLESFTDLSTLSVSTEDYGIEIAVQSPRTNYPLKPSFSFW